MVPLIDGQCFPASWTTKSDLLVSQDRTPTLRHVQDYGLFVEVDAAFRHRTANRSGKGKALQLAVMRLHGVQKVY